MEIGSKSSSLTPFSANIVLNLLFSSYSSIMRCLNRVFSSLLTIGVFLMFIALLAYFNVLKLSS